MYTEGSKNVGMGHISRSKLIYSYLSMNYDYKVTLLLLKNPLAQIFIKKTVVLPYFLETITIDDRNKKICQLIENIKPKLFIIDILDMDSIEPCITYAKDRKCKVVVIIDDTIKKHVNVDIIVNGNPNQIGQAYSKQKGLYLIGPKYFIMDTLYSKNTKVKLPKGDIKKIFLSFGGSDHNNLLFRIISIMGKIHPDIFLIIVSSKATGYTKRLKQYLLKQVNPYQLFLDVSSLADMWQQCDLAITAGGNTLFERISSQCPGATICQLERQMEIADKFEELDVNYNIGFGPSLSDKYLQNKINYFIGDYARHQKQYKNSPDVVDGKGLLRLGDEIQKIIGDF